MKKLLLFSCFNPDFGGGGVIFRSLISGLKGWDITWAYLGHTPCRYDGCRTVCLGKPFVGGPLISDLLQAPLLWSGIWQKPVRDLAQQLVSYQPDAFWILGFHEGILLIPELERITHIPIHVSIHDDQEKGVFVRSKRYAWMAGLARGPVTRALRAAKSVDVVSEGMRRYYQSEFGLSSKVMHLAIRDPEVRIQAPKDANRTEILVGHIGTLYDESVGMCFCEGLRALAGLTGRLVKWKVIGLSSKFKRLRAVFSDIIEDLGTLPEPDAIEILARCDVTYAMYPFQEHSRIFRMTSFPTKMSTYLMSGRLIFAHTPGDSTIAEFVSKFGVGLVCQSLDADKIAADLQSLLNAALETRRFEIAAADAFGIRNIDAIQNFLDSLAATNS